MDEKVGRIWGKLSEKNCNQHTLHGNFFFNKREELRTWRRSLHFSSSLLGKCCHLS